MWPVVSKDGGHCPSQPYAPLCCDFVEPLIKRWELLFSPRTCISRMHGGPGLELAGSPGSQWVSISGHPATEASWGQKAWRVGTTRRGMRGPCDTSTVPGIPTLGCPRSASWGRTTHPVVTANKCLLFLGTNVGGLFRGEKLLVPQTHHFVVGCPLWGGPTVGHT